MLGARLQLNYSVLHCRQHLHHFLIFFWDHFALLAESYDSYPRVKFMELCI